MNRPGDITRASLLYEGNYNEWETRMDGEFQLRGLASIASFTNVQPNQIDLEEWIQHGPVAQLILSNVSSAFVLRLPSSLLSIETGKPVVRSLLTHLKAHAIPFRLLALPTEIRKRIYSFVFGANNRYEIGANGRYTTRCEPLLHVSRQIRAEAHPIFYSTSIFTHDSKVALDYSSRITATDHWVKRIVKKQLKSLRHFDFVYGPRKEPIEVRID